MFYELWQDDALKSKFLFKTSVFAAAKKIIAEEPEANLRIAEAGQGAATQALAEGAALRDWANGIGPSLLNRGKKAAVQTLSL